ncbi:hypothetical protein [Pseudomonas sp. NPDC088444]|uniref:hypothetical protein n=1 Tax=Pseudomonas sp. NPDC088444 TaxID=3364456 RepID=UPI00384ADF82
MIILSGYQSSGQMLSLFECGRSKSESPERTPIFFGWLIFAVKRERYFSGRLSLHVPADRRFVIEKISEIASSPDDVVPGTFAGQGPNGLRGDVVFRIKGDDVVVTKPNGAFITTMKDGINNPSVQSVLKAAWEETMGELSWLGTVVGYRLVSVKGLFHIAVSSLSDHGVPAISMASGAATDEMQRRKGRSLRTVERTRSAYSDCQRRPKLGDRLFVYNSDGMKA